MAASISAYKIYNASSQSWSGWKGSPYSLFSLEPKDKVLYRIDTNVGSATSITSLSFTLSHAAETYASLYIFLYDEDYSINSSLHSLGSDSFSGNTQGHISTFDNLSLTGNQYLYVLVSNSPTYSCEIQAKSVSISKTLPTLTIDTISPSTVIDGDQVTVEIVGREGEELDIEFTANEYSLATGKVTADSYRQWTNNWFYYAYESGDSMTVTVSVSDANGRSASKTFTDRKAKAITPSISVPKSGTYDGSQQIAFAWTFGSGDGEVTSSTLEYSTDNANWQTLASVSGAATSWTAPAAKFPSGTVYWRIKTINSYDVDSNWVSASFTAKYNEASATPIAPKSSTLDGGQAIDFSWSIAKGGGTVTGVQLEISTNDGASWINKVDSTSQITSFRAAAGSLTAGKILWRVRANDSLIGWGAWQQANFTVQYNKPTVSLTAPTSGNRNGGAAIAFNWTIAAGSGNVTGTQMQYSTDEGVSWNALVNASQAVINYTATAGKFPAGKVMWRVRAQDQYAGWSDWKSASFTVQYTVPTVTLTTPTSGTREGGEYIEFAWSIAEGSGSVNGLQMQTSSDDGINWTTRLDVTTKRINFVADPATLPPGALKWRVRVKDSYAGWSEWKNASVTIKYSATSYVVPLNSPTGGNVNAAESITFAGTLKSNGTPYTPFTMASATFFWRSRASDPYTEISMTPEGANASVVIPGGTFPSGSVYWYIEATDNTGASTQTDVYTISTLASKIDAAPVAPVGVIETKNTPTIFRWRYATVTGSEQKAAELEYSIDGGASWIELGSVQGEETSYTAAANALPSGTITWRVRAENAANEWGEWSTPVSFVNFGAPDVFSVLTDGKPYTTITWQVNTQESYKLFVDGVQIGPYHGEDVRSYTLTQPLADGQHTVQIQVQNEYSQWSPINETVFDVVNTPGTAITLSHNTDVDVELTWTAGDGTGNYYVYRDGVPIAHTGEMEFVDRVALGTHEYFVIEKLASGDYTRSNIVTATPGVGCSPMIAPLAGGEWLPLALSLDSDRVIQISDEVRTSERFVLGADFPAVTIGRHRTRRVSLDAAWLRSSIRNEEFMALLGKAVILKLSWGDVFVGVLPAYAQSNTRFTSGYAYSISQADWRDYIDNT